jgi:uncharacterized membrane protein
LGGQSLAESQAVPLEVQRLPRLPSLSLAHALLLAVVASILVLGFVGIVVGWSLGVQILWFTAWFILASIIVWKQRRRFPAWIKGEFRMAGRSLVSVYFLLVALGWALFAGAIGPGYPRFLIMTYLPFAAIVASWFLYILVDRRRGAVS